MNDVRDGLLSACPLERTPARKISRRNSSAAPRSTNFAPAARLGVNRVAEVAVFAKVVVVLHGLSVRWFDLSGTQGQEEFKWAEEVVGEPMLVGQTAF